MTVVYVFVLIALVLMGFASWQIGRHRAGLIDKAHASSTSMGWGDEGSAPVKIDGAHLPSDLDPNRYKMFRIVGGCLSETGIKDGDLVVAEMFGLNDSKETKQKAIIQNDVLVIYLFDWKFRGYKVRVFDRIIEEGKDKDKGKADTYYYRNGEKKKSTKPHDLSKVVGIVRYVQNHAA